MIPCDSSKIHRWNALDDLDDGINDRINDDLIDDFDYDDPALEIPAVDSWMSSASTVDDSIGDEGKDRLLAGKTRSTDDNDGSDIDEDGLILALDDRTNRIRRGSAKRNSDKITKPSRGNRIGSSSSSSNSNSNLITVTVKKSVKYANCFKKSEPTGDSLVSNDDTLRRSNVAAPVLFDQTFGAERAIITRGPDGENSGAALDTLRRGETEAPRPLIASIHGDGTISYEHSNSSHKTASTSSNMTVSPNSNNSNNSNKSVSFSSNTTVSTVNSNKTAGTGNGVARISPRVATIHGDGTITYSRISESNIRFNTLPKASCIVRDQPPPRVATIDSNGIITYSGDAPKAARKTETDQTNDNEFAAITDREWKEAFDANPVTDDDDGGNDDDDDDDDDDDMDDDICDNLDHSRYTRSLHSMPVLEEVTEEESPLHASAPTTPEEGGDPRSEWTGRPNGPDPGLAVDTENLREEPTWLELRPSPSSFVAMTPRRTKDEHRDRRDGGTTQPAHRGRYRIWRKLRGLVSSSRVPGRDELYHDIDSAVSDRGPAGNPPAIPDHNSDKDSKDSILLRVETVSTGSQSEGEGIENVLGDDLETGGGADDDNGNDRDGTSRKHPPPETKTTTTKGGTPCCAFRRRDWMIAVVFVLIGLTLGIASFFVMNRIFSVTPGVDGGQQQQREEGRTEAWTTAEGGSPKWTIVVGDDEDTSTGDDRNPAASDLAVPGEDSTSSSGNNDDPASTIPVPVPGTSVPSAGFTNTPTDAPTDSPTSAPPPPTGVPTGGPTDTPTNHPTGTPSRGPTDPPTTDAPTTDAPTADPLLLPLPSFPEPVPGQPRVDLDRTCYESAGEDVLVVSYESVPPGSTDITIEVLSSSEVVEVLGDGTVRLAGGDGDGPPGPPPPPLAEALSCGRPSCHTWTSFGGVQIPTTGLTGGGRGYVVLLYARTTTTGGAEDGNNGLRMLAGDSFRLGGCSGGA